MLIISFFYICLDYFIYLVDAYGCYHPVVCNILHLETDRMTCAGRVLINKRRIKYFCRCYESYSCPAAKCSDIPLISTIIVKFIVAKG